MSIFDEKYSALYETIYAEKSYHGEVECIKQLLSDHSSEVQTILNFGCGTGKHDILLSELGFRITGIDRSHEMLKVARKKKSSGNPTFLHVDESDRIANESMDASLCLFDVFSYFNEDSEISNFFEFINEKAKPSSPLIFDFWYLPAVIRLKPETRKKTFQMGSTLITRVCEPSMEVSTSCIEATHQFFVENEKGIETFSETHRMRCFTKNEIRRILHDNGFELKTLGTWDDPVKEPDLNDWSVLAVATRID
jgi:SAM-dependent methyltransferase